MDELKPDVIGISEVWQDNSLQIEGYHPPIYKGRGERSIGGGVMILVKQHLNVVECIELNDHKFQEAVWCVIKLPSSEKVLVGVFYRSPNSKKENNEMLNMLLRESVKVHASGILIMGDFNYGQVKWSSGAVQGTEESDQARFLDTVQELLLYQHVTVPTRYREGCTPSLLDLVLTDEENRIDSIQVSQPLGKSDHVVLSWNFFVSNEEKGEYQHQSKPRYNYAKGQFQDMSKSLQMIQWGDLESMDVESMWLKIKGVIKDSITVYVPTHVQKKKSKAAPWWSKELTKEVKRKYKEWRYYTEAQLSEDYKKYVRQRNITTSLLRKAKSKYEERLVDKVRSEPKKLFKYIRSQQKVQPVISQLACGGRLAEADEEKAEILQDFFTSVFVEEGDGVLPDFPTVHQGKVIDDADFSPSDVKLELENLKIDKAAGPDEIPSVVLKECAAQLATPLFCLFRKSLESGVLPSEFKQAKITPIFKKGSRVEPGNYRPVSMTSQVCKVLERLIRKIIMAHLEAIHAISDHQHGFLPRKSCQTNMLESLEEWTRVLDGGDSLDIIFLDYQKAFDRVPHRRLIRKLHGYGIQGKLLNWIREFLSCRTQQVVVGNGQSSWSQVTSGVPQGSVLGPVLFLIYVNELPTVIQSSSKMFADDTKVYRSIKTPDDSRKLQEDLNALEKWSADWLLKFNSSKCRVMHCGSRNIKANYVMRNSEGDEAILEKTALEKDLGVTVSDNLKPTNHCTKAANKATSALRLLKKTFSNLNTKNFTVLFTTYVRPDLEYCLKVVGPYMKQDVEALEKVQRRATRLVAQVRGLTYEERLRKLQLPSIKERALRGDLIETYKVLTKKLEVDPSMFFEVDEESKTRGHTLKLKKRRSVSWLRSNFFSNRVVTAWNKLPREVVQAETINKFKNRLDQHWATVYHS